MKPYKKIAFSFVLFFFVIVEAQTVFALPSFRRLYQGKYRYKVSCNLCHKQGGGSAVTPYGKDFLRAGGNYMAFKKIEKKDSDRDGIQNIDEIMAKSNPGDKRSTPTEAGDWLADAEKVPVPKKSLKKVFSDVEKYAAIEGSLNKLQIAYVEKGVGQQVPEDDRVPTFYFAIEGKKKVGVAQFINARGPKGLISLAVAAGLNGKVTKVIVLKTKGDKAIKDEKFLSQFVGKDVKSPLIINQDIKPVTGNEKASKSITIAVKRALYIIQAVFSKKKK